MKFPIVSSLVLLTSTNLVEGADRSSSSSSAKEKEGIVPVAPKIVGGVEVNPPGKYPFMIRGGGCGASLVAPNVLLSAAHCASVFGGPFGIGAQIQIGRHNLSNSEEDYETFTVAEAVTHPSYNDVGFDYDYMMIRLDGFSNYEPVVLDSGDVSLDDGNDVVVMGWGTTSYYGPESSVLLEVEVDLYTQAACKAAYSDVMIDDYITDRMVCAARVGKNSCLGDSGGPLIDKVTGKQIGVVSWGYGCADENYPGVYAKVQDQSDWINDYIDFWDGLTSAPTPAPTPLICDDGEAKVTVNIVTDNYPAETEWTLKTGGMMLMDGSGYTNAGIKYTKSVCLFSACETLEFTINDSYGDGICCVNGAGSYEVLVDDIILAAGGEFSSSETTTFSICDNSSSSPTTLPLSVPPTPAPTPLPTSGHFRIISMADENKCIQGQTTDKSISLVDCTFAGVRQKWKYLANGYLSLVNTNKCLYTDRENGEPIPELRNCNHSGNFTKKKSFMINDRHNTIVTLAFKPGWALTMRDTGCEIDFQDYLSDAVTTEDKKHMWKFVAA